MTKAMALEWGRYGINVNAICPGYIDTEINHHQWQTERARSSSRCMPRKRDRHARTTSTPVLLMLCANESHFVNGAVISGRRRLRPVAARSRSARMRPLSLLEARVLGVLVEKALTVPDSYPLSLNALTLGCNQKTARDPVLAASEGEVQAAVDALKAARRWRSSRAARASAATSTTSAARSACRRSRWRCSRC